MTAHALQVKDLGKLSGEFVTLLGPSGSGKTTILMTIAGFTTPTEVAILIDGRDITSLPPERRSFGMVLQGYALFPHLTVAGSGGFPLRVRGSRPSRGRREDRAGARRRATRWAGRTPRAPGELIVHEPAFERPLEPEADAAVWLAWDADASVVVASDWRRDHGRLQP
ncbi:MAG: ATP-binding cassette domain-containing protein [Pseudomonadota bacterium]